MARPPQSYISLKRAKERLKNLPSPVKNTLGVLPYFIAGVLLALLLLFGLGVALGVREPIVTVMSDSMVPNLNVGDLVVLNRVDFGDIIAAEPACTAENATKGPCRENATIVVYWSDAARRLIIHRVWRVNEDGTLVTWGDNAANPDPAISSDKIRGKVAFRLPLLGWPRVLVNPIAEAIWR